jgi:hypothetical protein
MLFALSAVLVVLAYTAASYLLGRLVTATIGGSQGLAAALAAPAGASVLGAELWAFGAIHVPWNPLTLLLPPAILLLAGRSQLRHALGSDLEGARAWWREGRGDRVSSWLLVATLVVFLSLYMWALVVQPLEANDAIAVYMFKAKLFLTQGRVDLGPVIRDLGHNLAYPPLYSLLADTVYVVVGGVSDSLGKAVVFPFVIAAPLTLLVATARTATRRISGLCVAIWATMPLGLYHVFFANYMGYADYALAVMVLLVVASVAEAETTRDPRDYQLALVAAAIAAMLKNEGQVLLLTTALVTLFRVGRRGRGEGRARTLLIGVMAFAPVTAWKLVSLVSGYHAQLNEAGDLGRLLDSGILSRAIDILSFALHVTSFTNDFGWILVAVALVLEFTILNRSPNLARAAVLVLAVQVLAYFVTYLDSPLDINFHLSNSLDRLALQVTPALILLLALASSPTTRVSEGSP